jgi:hypothetical protein
MTAVPGSKHQERLRQEHQRLLSPGSSKHMALCKIMEVYDQEQADRQEIPTEVKAKLLGAPGLIFVYVETIPSGKKLYLPMKDHEDLVYQVHGNAAQLRGQMGKIEYEGLSLENGRVLVQRTWGQSLINVRTTTNLADIGRII